MAMLESNGVTQGTRGVGAGQRGGPGMQMDGNDVKVLDVSDGVVRSGYAAPVAAVRARS